MSHTTVSQPQYDDCGLLLRDVLGDGSCGYRAVMFGVMEHNWARAVDTLPIQVSSVLPQRRPADMVQCFDKHDAMLCQAARDLAARQIETDVEIHEWAGNPRDVTTEAARALREARTPYAYMDEVALHAMAKIFNTRIGIKFRDSVLIAPFKDNTDKRPVGVCLKPLADATPSDFVGHYMLCYPGKVLRNNVIEINPWSHNTKTV